MRKIKWAFLALCLPGTAWAQTYRMAPVNIQTPFAKQVNADNPLPEYPRPQLVRNKWTSLNGLWSYAITAKNAQSPATYDGKILVPFPLESALSGVKKSLQPEQQLWYRKIFTAPVLRQGERLLLHFGAVDYEAIVSVNGREQGKHTGGYQAFSFDITSTIKTGNNELVVSVWDPTDKGPNPHGKQVLNPGGIMYTPTSGIWQTVWLEIVPAVSVESLKLTPDVNNSALNIAVKLRGNNDGYSTKAMVIDNGKVIATQNIDGSSHVKINNVKLWSPDKPYLYDLKVQVLKDGKIIDEVKSYFGMRTIQVKKDETGVERIFLNNKYTYNLGTLDQGFWPDGLYTAPTDEALAFDIKAAKAMGFNTIRKHIKIEPARWYYHADKIGMLVWQDMPNPGNDNQDGRLQFEIENKENIDQLFHYPSIVCWVLFNEQWGSYDQQRLTESIKQYDPTRIVNGHSGEFLYVNYQISKGTDTAYVSADLTDIHSYPRPMNAPYKQGKARVLGEFGGIGVSVENHLWDDLQAGWGYGRTVSPREMRQQYASMIDTLLVLEKEGLSGSIYTQPFDVESEQNGMITYDRKVIKLPVEVIRSINARLWPNTENSATAVRAVNLQVAPNNPVNYDTRVAQFRAGKKDSLFLRNLAILADGKRDTAILRLASNAYVMQLKNPFADANLKFMKKMTRSTSQPAFDIMRSNIAKVDEVLGGDEVYVALAWLIEEDYIKPFVPKTGIIDWTTIEASIKQFGDIGEEALWQYQMFNSTHRGDWALFGEVAPKWFKKYGDHRKWFDHLKQNDVAWMVFEAAMDSSALEAALLFSKRSVDVRPEPASLDTYANLLYKLGRRDEALEWQRKAVEGPYIADDEIKGHYEKMKSGEKTWKEPEL